MTNLILNLLVMVLPLLVLSSELQQRVAERKPTITLRVLINNRILEDGEILRLKAGQAVQLKVEAVRKDGYRTDVTRHPKTQLLSLTPWILSVTNTGLLTASGSLQSTRKDDLGAIGISYGNPEDTEIGIATVLVEVDRAGPMDLQIQASNRVLRIGETAQIRVLEKGADGSTKDLTSALTGTVYETTSESLLVPEPDGKVTCIGTHDENRKFATIAIYNGNRHNKISFDLRRDGVGPSLEVTADKTVLQEGQHVRLHVYKQLANGGRIDLTATAKGTRYLTFSGYGVASEDVINISEIGLASATKSIGKYHHRTVIVFVRNGESVGWIQLRVNRANS
jgi:hypothetical protein